MIDANALIWPNNAVAAIAEQAEKLDEEVHVFRRPLRESDPNVSLGVFASEWIPDPQSFEMGQRTLGQDVQAQVFHSGPTLQQYRIFIQAFVKDMDEYRGLSKHSVFAKMVRDMLVRDPETIVALRGLSVVGTDGLTERSQRRWIANQRYISNEISGSWLYLATIEFMIETETA